MAYYKYIGGTRYDRRLLDAADAFTTGRGESRISLEEIQQLFQQAGDGQRITETERVTLEYIRKTYPFTEKAQVWFSEQLPDQQEDIATIAGRVLRQEYELPDIQYDISDTIVRQYNEGGGSRNVESVLRGALEAFLHGSQGQLSFVACVRRRDLLFNSLTDPDPLLKKYLNRGTLSLIPPNPAMSTTLPYDLPDGLDTANFWIFVLQTPDFTPIEFFAFVHREHPLQYSNGQFSKKADLEQTIKAVVKQYALFNRMKWKIPALEVENQLAIRPGQNFGNALFSALNAGIFNQESSFSFGDFIRQEVWPDPDTDIREQMREYANSGTLYLIPLDYREQTASGTAEFPIPEQDSFWMEGEWIFGLEMPDKTNIKILLNTPRDNNDGNTAWSNCFLDNSLTTRELLQRIVSTEFKVEGLNVNIDEAEYEIQRQQLGPEWRHIPGLFRQALNTILYDHLSINGIFRATAKRNIAAVDPVNHDDPKEYRDTVRHYIKNYLRTDGHISFWPNVPEENIAPNGESAEQNWIFRAVLQNLADHYFWIIIPRWPDDDQRPYNYIS